MLPSEGLELEIVVMLNESSCHVKALMGVLLNEDKLPSESFEPKTSVLPNEGKLPSVGSTRLIWAYKPCYSYNTDLGLQV